MLKNITKIAALSLLLTSCSLLDIDPDDVVSAEKAFSDVESYEMALYNVYSNLTSSTMTMQAADYAGDDFINVIVGYASTNYAIYYWDYVSQPQPLIWTYQYSLIANENVLIDNYDLVPTETTAEATLKDQIYAQALAMRAWGFFNLVQLYAPRYDGTNGEELAIPLKLTLELEILPQATLSEVYNQIFSDLDIAEQMLIDTSYNPTSSLKPYEFGLDAIRALRARVALFMGDTETAKQASAYFIDSELLTKDNYDAIWSTDPSSAVSEILFMSHDLSDTTSGEFLDYYEVFSGNNAVLSTELRALFSADDIRADIEYITSSYIPSKYLVEATETTDATRALHYKHFRTAEQYLIYAECVVESDPTSAMEIVNKLRTYRGAELLESTPTKAEVIDERRRELFSEGLRFYDLKRLAKELGITVERSSGDVLAPTSSLYVWDTPIYETNSNPYY